MDRFKRFRAYARAWATGDVPDGTHDNDIVAAAIGARAKLAESKLMTIQELDVTIDSLGISAEEEPGDDEPDVGPSARDKRELEDAQVRLRQLIATGGATDTGGRWLCDAAADEILRLRADGERAWKLAQGRARKLDSLVDELRQAKEALEQARAKVDELRAEVETDNRLIEHRDALLDALPCNLHGQCVPHALQEIARLRDVEKRANAVREQGAAGMRERAAVIVDGMASKDSIGYVTGALETVAQAIRALPLSGAPPAAPGLSAEDADTLRAGAWRTLDDGRWVGPIAGAVFDPRTAMGLRVLREKAAELRSLKAPAVAHEQPGKATGEEVTTAGPSSLTEEHGAAQDLACECPPGAPAQDRCDRAWTRCNARLRALRPELEPQGPSPKRDDDAAARLDDRIGDLVVDIGRAARDPARSSATPVDTSEPTARDAVAGMLLRHEFIDIARDVADGNLTRAEMLLRMTSAYRPVDAYIAAIEALARGDMLPFASVSPHVTAHAIAEQERDEARAEAAALRAELATKDDAIAWARSVRPDAKHMAEVANAGAESPARGVVEIAMDDENEAVALSRLRSEMHGTPEPTDHAERSVSRWSRACAALNEKRTPFDRGYLYGMRDAFRVAEGAMHTVEAPRAEEAPSGMRIEKRADGEWLVGATGLANDCDEMAPYPYRRGQVCTRHLNGEHLSCEARGERGDLKIEARWPIAAPAREDEPAMSGGTSHPEALTSADGAEQPSQVVSESDRIESSDGNIVVEMPKDADPRAVLATVAELLGLPVPPPEAQEEIEARAYNHGFREGERRRREYGLAAIGELARMQERDAAWVRITGAVDPEQVHGALLSTGRGAIERAHAEGVEEGERRAKVKAAELFESWVLRRDAAEKRVRDCDCASTERLIWQERRAVLVSCMTDLHRAFGDAPTDPGKPPTVDSAAGGPDAANQGVSERVPVVPGQATAEERAAFANGAAGPFTPHAEVMAGVCERAHADGIVEGLRRARRRLYAFSNICDELAPVAERLDRDIEAAAAGTSSPADPMGSALGRLRDVVAEIGGLVREVVPADMPPLACGAGFAPGVATTDVRPQRAPMTGPARAALLELATGWETEAGRLDGYASPGADGLEDHGEGKGLSRAAIELRRFLDEPAGDGGPNGGKREPCADATPLVAPDRETLGREVHALARARAQEFNLDNRPWGDTCSRDRETARLIGESLFNMGARHAQSGTAERRDPDADLLASLRCAEGEDEFAGEHAFLALRLSGFGITSAGLERDGARHVAKVLLEVIERQGETMKRAGRELAEANRTNVYLEEQRRAHMATIDRLTWLAQAAPRLYPVAPGPLTELADSIAALLSDVYSQPADGELRDLPTARSVLRLVDEHVRRGLLPVEQSPAIAADELAPALAQYLNGFYGGGETHAMTAVRGALLIVNKHRQSSVSTTEAPAQGPTLEALRELVESWSASVFSSVSATRGAAFRACITDLCRVAGIEPPPSPPAPAGPQGTPGPGTQDGSAGDHGVRGELEALNEKFMAERRRLMTHVPASPPPVCSACRGEYSSAYCEPCRNTGVVQGVDLGTGPAETPDPRWEPGAVWEHRAYVVRRLELRQVDEVRAVAFLSVQGTWSATQSVPCADMTAEKGWRYVGRE